MACSGAYGTRMLPAVQQALNYGSSIAHPELEAERCWRIQEMVQSSASRRSRNCKRHRKMSVLAWQFWGDHMAL
jgi:hypothetical protein